MADHQILLWLAKVASFVALLSQILWGAREKGGLFPEIGWSPSLKFRGFLNVKSVNYARYYDPVLGRFLSPDSIVQAPFNPQNLNRYSYVGNNPANFTDPSGSFFFPNLGGLVNLGGCFVCGVAAGLPRLHSLKRLEAVVQ